MTDPGFRRPSGLLGGDWFLILFGLIWTLVTLGFDVAVGVGFWKSLQTTRYVATDGTVTVSRVDAPRRGKNGPNYRPVIEYDYEVAGAKLHGDQRRAWEIGLSGTSARRAVQRIVGRYPAGQTVTVYYSPTDPQHSVLEPGIAGIEHVAALFAMPFNMIMLGIWAIAFMSWRAPTHSTGRCVSERGDSCEVIVRNGPVVVPALAAMGGLAFASLFITVFTMGFEPPLGFMYVVWSIVFVGGVIAAIVGSRWRQTLRLDALRRSLALPASLASAGPVVAAAQIRSLTVTTPDQETAAMLSRDLPRSTLTLHFEDDFGEVQSRTLCKSLRNHEARALGALIRETLGLSPEVLRDVNAVGT